MSYANFIFILFPQMVTIHPSHFKRVLPTPVCYRGVFKSLRLHRLLYLNCRMCTNRTSPRMSKIRMLPSQPTLVFVGITGLEPAPLFLTPVPKTGRIPITDYIPSLLCRQVDSNHAPKDSFYRRVAISE